MYPGGQGTVSIFTVFPSYGIFDVMFSYWFLRFCLFIWFDWLLYIFFYMCKSSMHVHVKISYMCFILSIAKKLVLRIFPSNPKIYFLWSYYFSVQSDFILNNKNQENNRVGRTVKYTGKFNIQTLVLTLRHVTTWVSCKTTTVVACYCIEFCLYSRSLFHSYTNNVMKEKIFKIHLVLMFH